MLRSLRVKDFALLADVIIEPGPGLVVFTGETGAGKSLLIEALGFLLGERGSTDWIRAGARKLEVEGRFDASRLPEPLRRELGCAQGELVLRRELDDAGRGRAFVNGVVAPAAKLAALGDALADFHGQHEHQTLLKTALQLELLDAFGGCGRLRAAAAAAHAEWKRLCAEQEALSISEEERLRRVELCRFQMQEIDEVGPKPGEDAELEAELPRLKNSARLIELCEQACEVLSRQEGSVEELLSKSARLAAELSRLDPSLAPLGGELERSRDSCREAAARLSDYRGRVEDCPAHLDSILLRQDKLARLKKKYGPALEDVAAHREKVGSEMNLLERREERSADVAREIAAAESALARLCGRLHEERAKAAKKLSERAVAQLKDLGMGAARFCACVEAEEGAYSSCGWDRVEFLIAPNPGEPLKSLRSIASGGELSRVMLALKTVFSQQDRVGLLVFDEIDSGVGGSTARAVGAKLRELGRARQVFCVTHLPQVACYAQGHFEVSKRVSGGRTAAHAERLEGARRLDALASMLGGAKATETSRRHAQELLQSL